MKTRLTMYLAVTAAFIISAFALGERILFICACVFAGIFALVFLANLIILLGLSIKQDISETGVSVGEKSALCVFARNRTPIPVPELIISYRSPHSDEDISVHVWIAPFEEISVTLKLPCPHRGEYEVGLISYRTVDMLGLTALSRRVKSKRILTVYPAIFKTGGAFRPSRRDEGESARRGATPSSGVADIVPYIRGSTMRHIHWKLTARRSELMMKVLENESEPETVILIDCAKAQAKPEDSATLEDIITSVASSICGEALVCGVPARVLAYTRSPLDWKGTDLGDFAGLHLIMAKLPFESGFSAADALYQAERLVHNRHSALIYITSYISAEVFDLLMAVRGEISVVLVSGGNLGETDGIISSLTEKGVRAIRACPGDDLEEIFGKAG